MKAKILCSSILCCVASLLTSPSLLAQDLSKYRTFSLGASLASVLKRTDQKLADAKVVHGRPALIQEVTWWPPTSSGPSLPFDGVEQLLFSFYNGELYKISVDYDRTSTEGLTAEDIVRSISTKYGPATSITAEAVPAPSESTRMSKWRSRKPPNWRSKKGRNVKPNARKRMRMTSS
jgi:hypothetical protein